MASSDLQQPQISTPARRTDNKGRCPQCVATGKSVMLSLLPLWSGGTSSCRLPEKTVVGKRTAVTGEGQPVTETTAVSPVKIKSIQTENPCDSEDSASNKKKNVGAQLIGQKMHGFLCQLTVFQCRCFLIQELR